MAKKNAKKKASPKKATIPKKAAPKKAASKNKTAGSAGKLDDLQKMRTAFKTTSLNQPGMRLTGLHLTALDKTAGFTCDKRVPQTTGSGPNKVIKWVCVEWSDGQDHSNDPDVPDTP